MPLQRFKDLEVWHKAMDLTVDCYKATQNFPKSEVYGLTSQIRRASSSIPANIAEGQGRNSTKEFLQFLSIARGSLNELETHLILSERLGYLLEPDMNKLLTLADTISRMLTGLKRTLERRL